MRIFNKFRDTHGFLSIAQRMLRFGHMRNQSEAERRVRILSFWKEHGDKTTKDAFDVSRRTLYRWSLALAREQGKLTALDPQSTAPARRRQRIYPPGFTERIITLRREHPRLGKE